MRFINGFLVFSDVVLASDATHDCEECNISSHDIDAADDYEWEKEVTVELNGEEVYTYPKNPNYRYTFIWTTPSKARAVCYMCGMSAMSTVNRMSQYSCIDRACPIALAGLYNDYYNTWHTRTYERCTACGYESEGFNLRVTYTSFCRNGDNRIENGEEVEWEVREEYTMANGYDLHQSLRWWLYYSYE